MPRAILPAVLIALAPLTGAACDLPEGGPSLRTAVLSGVSGIRARAALVALAPDASLERAAQAHACDMARRGRIGHRGGDFSGLRSRLRRAGYPFAAANENVAAGHEGPAALVGGWMVSAGQRANLLAREVAEAGIGVARGADGRLDWVMIAARRR